MNIRSLNIDISGLTFLFIIAFAFIFYYFGFDGLVFSDDFSYAYYAHQLTEGTFNPADDIFAHRFGIIFPVAVGYFLFGVNDITTTIFPFTCFIGTAILCYLFLYKTSKTAALAAMVLFTLSFYPIYFSNKLFPDVIVCFFATACSIVLVKRSQANPLTNALIVSVSFFYGFLVKETILYLLPFILIIFAADFSKGRYRKFWMLCWSLLLALFFLYFLIYYFLTGNPLYRFQVIQDGHYVSAHSYFDKSLEVILARLTYEPFQMLFQSELWIPVLAGLPTIIYIRQLSAQHKGILIAALVTLLTFWFGTTSLQFYNPISLNPRMFIMVVPLWAIAGGIAWDKGIKGEVFIPAFLTTGFLVAAQQVVDITDPTKGKNAFIYFFLSVLCLILVLVRNKWLRSILTAGIVIILMIHPIYTIHKSSSASHNALKEIIPERIPPGKEAAVIITDPLLSQGYLYFTQFKPIDSVKVVSYGMAKSMKMENNVRYYALVCTKNLQELEANGFNAPDIFWKVPSSWMLITKIDGVGLYELPGLPAFR